MSSEGSVVAVDVLWSRKDYGRVNDEERSGLHRGSYGGAGRSRQRMKVRQVRQIGYGAFGTVVQAYVQVIPSNTSSHNSSYMSNSSNNNNNHNNKHINSNNNHTNTNTNDTTTNNNNNGNNSNNVISGNDNDNNNDTKTERNNDINNNSYLDGIDQSNLSSASPDNNERTNATQRSTWEGPYAIKQVPALTEYKSREVPLLQITDHQNVVKLMYYYRCISSLDGKDYQHLVMECLPNTLQHEILKYGPKMPLTHTKLYTYQLARGMLYLHSLGICHRDVKPSNILVNPETGELKICDFGSAKQLGKNDVSISYICSRFYRAPELIVGCTQYTTQVDIWGLGCVIGEMIIGKAVFQGSTKLSQLEEIAKLLGPPDKTFIFFSNPNYDGPLFSRPLFSGTSEELFKKYFGHAGVEAPNILMEVLRYSPEKRLSPRRVMAHPFLDDLRNETHFYPTDRSQQKPFPPLFDFSENELRVIGSLRSQIEGTTGL